jgi:hypothetical protein
LLMVARWPQAPQHWRLHIRPDRRDHGA